MEAGVVNKNWTQVLTERIHAGNDETSRYARAEKQICDELGPMLAKVIVSAELVVISMRVVHPD
jgi:hypothetical protein